MNDGIWEKHIIKITGENRYINGVNCTVDNRFSKPRGTISIDASQKETPTYDFFGSTNAPGTINSLTQNQRSVLLFLICNWLYCPVSKQPVFPGWVIYRWKKLYAEYTQDDICLTKFLHLFSELVIDLENHNEKCRV